MKNYYYQLIALLVLFVVHSSFAQSITISGVVTEKGTNTPLVGVNVILKGTSKGGMTDFDGKYSITTSELGEQQLVFSFVGYKTITVPLTGNDQVINVELEEDATSLDEVVVTALGIKREAKALGYSLTEVGGDEMSQVKTASAVNSLQGRVAGVNISTTSTGAAGSSRVIIRGASSLTGNNQPLYVVDGIPIINNTNGSVVGPTNDGTGDGGDDISTLNPDDIESVSILKGSSAAALYGSLASNGVIMITTKSGKGKENFGVEFSSSLTFDKINTDLLNLQTTYGQGRYGLKPGYEFDTGGNPVEIADQETA
ncbi:MAG: carboxypeptidase-like regulatory domain-containing protein, partial [Flavobacteriaceae bacterium]|nr:carboxypeptidase-like regulatory domain-containing protein [Flavobacteriaceae bacterium]